MFLLKCYFIHTKLFRGRKSCHCSFVELVKLFPMQQYSVDIFPYSGPSGIFGSDRKQKYRLSRCWGRENFLHFPLVLMNRLNKTESAGF